MIWVFIQELSVSIQFRNFVPASLAAWIHPFSMLPGDLRPPLRPAASSLSFSSSSGKAALQQACSQLPTTPLPTATFSVIPRLPAVCGGIPTTSLLSKPFLGEGGGWQLEDFQFATGGNFCIGLPSRKEIFRRQFILKSVKLFIPC